MSDPVVTELGEWLAQAQSDLTNVEVALAVIKSNIESDLASHSNTTMLLDAAMSTLNAERARADLAERKLKHISKGK